MWFGLRDKTQLLYAPQLQARILQLEEQLRAERRLTGEYDKALDESLEVNTQLRAVNERLSRTIAEYEALIEQKVKPIGVELQRWCRGEQHSFKGDSEC